MFLDDVVPKVTVGEVALGILLILAAPVALFILFLWFFNFISVSWAFLVFAVLVLVVIWLLLCYVVYLLDLVAVLLSIVVPVLQLFELFSRLVIAVGRPSGSRN